MRVLLTRRIYLALFAVFALVLAVGEFAPEGSQVAHVARLMAWPLLMVWAVVGLVGPRNDPRLSPPGRDVIEK